MAAPMRTFNRLFKIAIISKSSIQESLLSKEISRNRLLAASNKTVCCRVFSSGHILQNESKKDLRPQTNEEQKTQHDVIRLEVDIVEDEEVADVLYSKLVLEVKGHDDAVLTSYQKFVQLTSKCLGLEECTVEKPKYDVFRRSLLKSVHVFKKHYVQYEQRTYYRIFTLPRVTGSTADTLLEYIQRNLPEGIAMKVTKHRLEALPEKLRPPQMKSETKVSS
ncbi:28S ribosomal protein S10, mitochondrial-like [Mya arenaria]|uniref:28S ribosomal protein S10, mitochondrial-like n=1 Tax=Mya arenaria TaxID=6604 RepID=UPI0022E90003|nr:28S ribosomal protein S10, mitochondrial-like [Mya arenaria]